MFLYDGGSISWKSFKQSIIVDSTMEAEYIAALEAIKEAFLFKSLLRNLMSCHQMPSHYTATITA